LHYEVIILPIREIAGKWKSTNRRYNMKKENIGIIFFDIKTNFHEYFENNHMHKT